MAVRRRRCGWWSDRGFPITGPFWVVVAAFFSLLPSPTAALLPWVILYLYFHRFITGSGDDGVVVDFGGVASFTLVVVVMATDSSLDSSLLDNVLCKLRYFHDGYCCDGALDDDVVVWLSLRNGGVYGVGIVTSTATGSVTGFNFFVPIHVYSSMSVMEVVAVVVAVAEGAVIGVGLLLILLGRYRPKTDGFIGKGDGSGSGA